MPMMILKVMRQVSEAGTGSASGTSGRGGNVIVNGGYVKAVGNGSGYGIGNGGNKTPYGTITINGGSVDATLGTTPNNDPSFDAFNNSGTIPATKYNQYLVETTIDGITDEQDVEYSLVSDNDTGAEKKIKTRTDKNGKLYLYANAGNNGFVYIKTVQHITDIQKLIRCQRIHLIVQTVQR